MADAEREPPARRIPEDDALACGWCEAGEQFDPAAQAAVVAALERRAWGDMALAIRALDKALRLALAASRSEFLDWQDRLEIEHEDEFSVPVEAIASMDARDRLAYLARLLRTVALMWGAETEFSMPAKPAYDELGGLLRELVDISTGWDRRPGPGAA